MSSLYLITSCAVLSLFMSCVYFYAFAKRHERFIQFWGISWIIILISLLFVVLALNFQVAPLLEYRKVVDMFQVLFLLLGVYAFHHIRIPTYWTRFALYLLIWALIGSFYHFDTLSIYLPIASYQAISSVHLCYIIGRYWNIPTPEKLICIVIFSLWGLGKSIFCLWGIYFSPTPDSFLWEVLATNILCFCFFILYSYRIKASAAFSEHIYKLIAENATDVIFYYELHPRSAFRYITPSVERLTGYTPSEFYANPKFYLELAFPEEMKNFSAIFQGDFDDQEQKIFRIQNKDRSIIWVEINDSILYENGVAIAIEGIMRDVTRAKEEEDAMISAKQSRDLLLSYISHELKTPITAILGYINGLKDGTWKTESERDTALDIIFSKSLMLQRLIQDLVQLSKLEAKQFSFQLTHVSALELCENMIDRHMMDVQGMGAALQVTIDRTLLEKTHLIVDTERIEQVFINIIFNALKYGKKNGTIQVSCSLDRELKNLVVQVADDGNGIPPEDLPYIFERFYRGRYANPHTEDSGSGLGLTLSREIIQSFQGNIWAHNAKSGGSVFTFTLPLYRESSVD